MQTVSFWALLALYSGYVSAKTLELSPIHVSQPNDGQGPSDHVSLAWSRDDTMVTLELAMNYSTVVLETLVGLSAVDCDDTSVLVTFSDKDEFDLVQSSWTSLNGSFVLVTNHMGDCDAEFERGFFLADVETLETSAADLTIRARVEKTDVSHTSAEIVANYSHTPTVPMKRGITWNKEGLELEGDISIDPGTELFKHKDLVTVTADRASLSASMLYSGTIKYSIAKWDLTQWTMDVIANVHQDLALSFDFAGALTFEFEHDLLPVKPPTIKIPGILNLGPALNLGFGTNFTVNSTLGISTSFTSGINNGSLHIDFLEPELSAAKNWMPTYKATANITAEAGVTITPYAHATLEMEAKILGGLLDLSVGAQIRPGFPMQFGGDTSLGAAAGSNMTADAGLNEIDRVCPNGFGMHLGFVLDIVLYASQWNKRFIPLTSSPIGTYCYDWF